ncbi:MAG: 3-phosphoserine/phosphohydroxythreonine transaminase [Clostridiales bacterium]|nr:3-phosphoserine/phosphohydroxythreonine transaminase [Clostridiales bacterium]
MRVCNFSAGPGVLPEKVLQRVQAEMLDYGGTGMSVAEMSHRSKPFEEIVNRTVALFKELMNIPDDYYVLLLQGGASLQFEAVPLNLLKNGKADYVVTGNFAKKAYKEAQKYGDIACVASSEDKDFTYIPALSRDMFRRDADYVHITSNNTIYGTRYTQFPDTGGIPLVCDMSSNILSEEMDVSKFGLIYAGAQKNIAPAGLTVVIVRKDLCDNPLPICPTMLRYSTHGKKNSLYNTPPCFSIYVAMLVLEWLKEMGGVKEIQKINCEKAQILYDFIDNSKLYKNPVRKEDRSIMNVPFVTGSHELDEKFVKEAKDYGIVSIKGHRSVGGMRASIYNAMPIEGVKKLIEFMKKFELENA